MKYLIIIPARKQSKEIKNKNKIRIGKLSLIEYTLIETIKCKFNYKICLSTDDKDIINIAKKYNIVAPFLRPSYLSKDNTSMKDVIMHAINWYNNKLDFYPEYIILLQPTSPNRKAKDILSSVKKIEKLKGNSLISVSEVKHHPCEYVLESNNKIKFVMKPPKMDGRQNFPKVFFIDGSIYITKTKFFIKNQKLFDSNTILYKQDNSDIIDIDSESDLNYFKYLIKRQS